MVLSLKRYFSVARQPSIRSVVHFLILGVSYAVSGYVGIELANLSYGISLIWPPIGIAIALLLRWGLTLWPAIALGGFTLQLLVSDFSLISSAILAMSSALIITAHCYALTRMQFDRRLEQVRDMLIFVAVGIVLCSMVLALWGVSFLVFIGIVPLADIVTAWWSWFLGDVTGVLIFGIALLVHNTKKLAALLRPENLLAFVLLLLIGAEVLVLNKTGIAITMTLMPMVCLLWIAMRTNLVATSWVVVSFSAVAVYSVYNASGIFANVGNPTLGTWFYITSMGLASLIISVSAVQSRLKAELMQFAISATRTGIWDLRLGDDVLYVNAHLMQNLGYEAKEQRNPVSYIKSLLHPEDVTVLMMAVQRYLKGETEYLKLVVRMRHQSGAWRDMQIEGAATEKNLSGKAVRLGGTLIDITENRRLQQKLHAMAMSDELTGIANRRAFMQQLEQRWQYFLRDARQNCCVMLLDLDLFKQVNDQYGHDIGDKVLQRFAVEISSHLRVTDIFARLGGEEFVVLVNVSSQSDCFNLAEKLRLVVADCQFEFSGCEPFSISVSIGVAGFSAGQEQAKDVLKYADNALYQAKSAGRNRVVLWYDQANSVSA